MLEIKISVIIPVFNAERFLEKSVSSILAQEEVNEIILVEDGSTDNSLKICQELTFKFPSIKLLQHKGHNKNLGAAASRNLGIINAENTVLAFLDADDYFLPERFKNTIRILTENPQCDGVYEAIGAHYYDKEGKELHEKRMAEINIEGLKDLTTLTKSVHPSLLFETLIMGNKGWFHFNGLTLRKSAIIKTGFLDEYLWYGQDIDFFLRLAISAELLPGELEKPVAMRGVYASNSTLSIYTNNDRLFMNQRCNSYRWSKMFNLMMKMNFSTKVNRFLVNRHLDYYDDDMMNSPINFKRKIRKTFLLFKLILTKPGCYSKIVK